MTQQGSAPDHGAPDVTIANVRFEHRRGALGVGTAEPRLSWIIEAMQERVAVVEADDLQQEQRHG